jgi:gamma-aminobutyric acid type B receptor
MNTNSNKMIRSFLSLLGWLAATLVGGVKSENLTFGLINGGSPFFEPLKPGWEYKCKELGVTCLYADTVPNGTCEYKVELAREFIAMNVDGIALKPCRLEDMSTFYDEALEAGIPIVNFDFDNPNSTRAAYVGTDNMFLGRTMARLLRQLRPEGGTFAIIAPKEGRNEGFIEEITKYNEREGRAHWFEVQGNFSYEGIEDDWIQHMELYALLEPTALITMRQSPMRAEEWPEFVDANRHRNITYIGTDGSDYQLEYLNRRYVDGLIGQLPYEFGSVSAQVLYDLATKGTLEKTFFPTNVVAYNLIPLELPPLDLNENLIGNVKYLGFVCFGLVALCAAGFVLWTFYHRASLVVQAAQPFFLVMVAGGVLLMASSLVPLSFDDGGESESMSHTRSVGICMSVPWLAFTGFTVTFSALFSKTWRVNQMFNSKVRHARIKVTEKDVLAPFAVLLTGNIIVLIIWTVLDPLTYIRQEYDGTDYWNRNIATYGACRSDKVVAYLVPLAIINLGVVVTACWQALQARNIESEFSEAKYIGFTVGSWLW